MMSGVVNLELTLFEECQATNSDYGGGAVFADTGTLKLYGVSFLNNNAASINGDDVYTEDAAVTVYWCPDGYEGTPTEGASSTIPASSSPLPHQSVLTPHPFLFTPSLSGTNNIDTYIPPLGGGSFDGTLKAYTIGTCSVCPNLYFSSGGPSCTPCPIGSTTYGRIGAAICTACPNGLTSEDHSPLAHLLLNRDGADVAVADVEVAGPLVGGLELSIDAVSVEADADEGGVPGVARDVVADGVDMDVVRDGVAAAAVHEHLVVDGGSARVVEVGLARPHVHASGAASAGASAGHAVSGAVIEAGLKGAVNVDAAGQGHGDAAEDGGGAGVRGGGAGNGLLLTGRGRRLVLAELVVALVGDDGPGELAGGHVVRQLGGVAVVGGPIVVAGIAVRGVALGRGAAAVGVVWAGAWAWALEAAKDPVKLVPGLGGMEFLRVVRVALCTTSWWGGVGWGLGQQLRCRPGGGRGGEEEREGTELAYRQPPPLSTPAIHPAATPLNGRKTPLNKQHREQAPPAAPESCSRGSDLSSPWRLSDCCTVRI